MSKKGFIFTYDAIMAIALALLFLNLFLIVSRPSDNTYAALTLSRTANDFLASGEKSGVFGTKDNDTIVLYMNQTLPGNIHAELNMKVYNRTFDITEEFNVSRTGNAPTDTSTVARRVFLIHESGNLTEIGLVTLEVWRGDYIG
jgi:hypothetical protein